jgi:hypothetical protein
MTLNSIERSSAAYRADPKGSRALPLQLMQVDLTPTCCRRSASSPSRRKQAWISYLAGSTATAKLSSIRKMPIPAGSAVPKTCRTRRGFIGLFAWACDVLSTLDSENRVLFALYCADSAMWFPLPKNQFFNDHIGRGNIASELCRLRNRLSEHS